MGNPITDAFDLAGKALYVIIMGFVFLIVLLTVLNWYFENQQTLHKTVAEVCGLESKFKTIVTEELVNSIPENTPQQKKAKEVLSKIAWSQRVTDEEYQTVLDVLDIVQKRKLGLEDLEKVCYFT